MSGAASRLGRLLAIRRLTEDLDRRALAIALASVAEVEAGIRRQEAELSESRAMGRAALGQGNRPEWLMADAQVEVAGWNRQRLEKLLSARTEGVAGAMRNFLKSRSEHAQVKQLVQDARGVEIVEGDRKAQAAADDWFLSRRGRSED